VIARDRVIEENKAVSLSIENDGYAVVPQVATAKDISCLLFDFPLQISAYSVDLF
jgi:hypothetical protein